MDLPKGIQATVSVPSVNIRPGVSVLSVLKYLNYKPWFAMAEFVDNSLQSYLTHRQELVGVEGAGFKLGVTIELDLTDAGRIVIRDNAAGIHTSEYERAFRPAELPPDRSGLAEFGMGMKSAACWFAPRWSVRTSALGEPIERTVCFDIDTIVRDNLEDLAVDARAVPATAHYTEVVLSQLHRPPQGQTIGKIKKHLASIYRAYLREGILELRFDRELLIYEEPHVLVAPYFKEPAGEVQRWFKELDLDFGLGWRVQGFAALRETASTSAAGFGLFRRKRLIQGSADESYRPGTIFGKPNSYAFQRLFGELSLNGFEVSHTKDGFRWEEHEDLVLEELKKALDAPPLPLLRQAEGHRARQRTVDIRPGAQAATERTAETIEREAPPVLQHQLEEEVEADPEVRFLPPTITVTKRCIDISLNDRWWRIELELSNDPAVSDWVSSYDTGEPSEALGTAEAPRTLGIRLALAHPFMERFGGAGQEQIEPLLRVAVALVLAEITAREGGAKFAGEVRRRVNELLRDALSKP